MRPTGAAADVLTSDGRIVAVRPVQPDDRTGLAALYRAGSPESLRLRFFGPPSGPALDVEVDRLCRPQSNRHLAVLALDGEQVIGVAACDRTDDIAEQAEFAVFVADAHHGRGVGTLLLEHLAALARRRGIQELVGEVLPVNQAMLRVARDLNARAWSRFGDNVVDVGIGTGTGTGTGRTSSTTDERDRTAERVSLHSLLQPASVAVVGAGRVGHEAVQALVGYGFTGRVHVVDATVQEVAGIPACASVAQLPAPVDLLVITVSGDQLLGVLADGAKVGVRAAVVLGRGFDPSRPEGRERQHELVEFARRHTIRLVGPDSRHHAGAGGAATAGRFGRTGRRRHS
ncbi:GNAT family N-acetyltransferase [Paractinoplanes brasiliensis]|uniref:Acetyltransferase (GNAT) family protein n=1 Tax=Paractinoplanes brasiliensis TaxID=52695 RepID=A0A4R6JMW0_9ACTN|nr:GNAT family N-acetyltransferase [Actinoplanes brasiliensis]TDO36701.1 acetyltransferase (GNAT) family protein [Actinoplanes brasiliensis]GID32338.1 hypothetical protein Abr02nite_73210 [Actinoplanes brasiliensis]